jgi:hypothetical protein
MPCRVQPPVSIIAIAAVKVARSGARLKSTKNNLASSSVLAVTRVDVREISTICWFNETIPWSTRATQLASSEADGWSCKKTLAERASIIEVAVIFL